MNGFIRKAHVLGTTVLLALLCAACLEHEEVITVAPDGSTEIVAQITGDYDQYTADDLLLPQQPQWTVLEQRIDSTGDKRKLTYRASLFVPSGSPLPESFAKRENPYYDLSLRFPTQVKVWTEGNRTYYEFRRTYQARRFSALDVTEIPILWDQELEERVLDSGLLNINQQDRRQYLDQLVSAFSLRLWRLHRDALGDLVRAGSVSDTTFLRLTEEVAGYLEETITPELALDLIQLEEIQVERALDSIETTVSRRFQQAVHTAVGGKTLLLRQYEESIKRTKMDYALTQKLDSREMSIELNLPGTIISSNGIVVPEEPGRANWWFRGDKLHDADLPLYALSVVTR